MNSSHLLLWFRSAQLSRARYGNAGVLCVCASSRISVWGWRNVLDKIAGVTQNPAQSNVVNMAAIYKVQEVHRWQVEMRTVDGSNVQAKTNRWGAFLSAPELLISKDRTLRTLGYNLHDYGQTQCQRFTSFWPCRVTVCSACVTTVCVCGERVNTTCQTQYTSCGIKGTKHSLFSRWSTGEVTGTSLCIRMHHLTLSFMTFL